MQQFDAIIIGTGAAGATVAQSLSEAGKSVAIVDRLPFGGTCSQRGCDPKKILVGAAEIIARAEQMAPEEIRIPPVLDWSALIRFKKTFTDPIPQSTEDKYKKLGISMFHGDASFVSADIIQVGEEQLRATYIVLATGASPHRLNIPGEDLLIDSTRFMELDQLPDELVMVGGGYIAFEFAHIAARAGAKVTIIHRGKRPLEGFDADVVALLVKATGQLGIQVILDASVTNITGTPGNLTVSFEKSGNVEQLSAKLVVHAAGRTPSVGSLALDKANVAATKKGITVNEYLQSTTNPMVYACGDVSDKGLPLTPLASYEGRIVATNILNGNSDTFVNDAVPSTVFTIPPLASVGLTEEQAREKGQNVTVLCRETTDWYSSKRINETVSGFKTLVDKDTGLVVGAHLLGDHSEEVINLFAMAIKFKIRAESLRHMLFAYPTHASDISYMID